MARSGVFNLLGPRAPLLVSAPSPARLASPAYATAEPKR
jgi:hypothetical protein